MSSGPDLKRRKKANTGAGAAEKLGKYISCHQLG